MTHKSILAIIGGSGLYTLPELENVTQTVVETPYGRPSSPLVAGKIGETRVLFIARHGKGHTVLPGEINYRANIYALKQAGATHLVSVSAVGSLKEEIEPGDLAIAEQYIDRTKGRSSTFFGDGIAGHVMFGDPVCGELSQIMYDSAQVLGHKIHRNTTLLTMEGPAFSTRAESNWHRRSGADLIGMTAMPEARLAREAELCYGTLALATDYDSWKDNENVTVDAVMDIMKNNVQKSRQMIVEIAGRISNVPRECSCSHALDFAIVTDKNLISKEIKQRLEPIMGRVL
jgi:5'-methylthioadenosine phosphorylase